MKNAHNYAFTNIYSLGHNKLITKLNTILLLVASSNSFGQSNTMTLGEGQISPRATLSDVSWVEGHWKGKAFGGETEEIWGSPIGNSMMCAFKHIVDSKVQFYEIESISEENSTLILRLKHFHPNLKGWEEKDKTVDFKLVKVTKSKVYFDDYTFEKVSDNEMNVYVVIEIDSEREEVKFNYRRNGL